MIDPEVYREQADRLFKLWAEALQRDDRRTPQQRAYRHALLRLRRFAYRMWQAKRVP